MAVFGAQRAKFQQNAALMSVDCAFGGPSCGEKVRNADQCPKDMGKSGVAGFSVAAQMSGPTGLGQQPSDEEQM